MDEKIDPILTALEFIERKMVEPITVADIAAAAGYSLYHFIRTFNQIVKHTPYDYLIRRRLSMAALELLDSERRVIDIALDYQFNNHETFTRAFNRIFRMPPTRWREQRLTDPRVLMPAFDRDFLAYVSAQDFSPPRAIVLDEICLAGLMAPLDSGPDGLTSLWKELKDILQLQSSVLAPYDFWGVRTPLQIPGGNVFYLAGLKITIPENIHPTFAIKILPAGDYITFSPPRQVESLDAALQVLYHIFVPKSGWLLADPLEIEHFGEKKEILIPVQEDKTRKNLLK